MTKTNILLFLWGGIIFLNWSCANYRVNTTEESQNWHKEQPAADAKIRHTVYLAGDAGRIFPDEPTPVLDVLKRKLNAASENTTMVFLGNQLYPNGMPPKAAATERQLAEYQLDTQLDVIKGFKGRPLFIPGNRDWRKYGLKGVKRQEKYIEKRLKALDFDTDDLFLPDEGCGDFKTIDINDQLGIIAVDSEWYLHDWDKEPEINDGCEIKSLKVFDFNFQDEIRKYRNKNAIVVMHHPPVSYGTYGGRYPVKEHLFPFTAINRNLYLPLPIVGSAAMFARATFGNRQALSNGQYKLLRESVIGSAEKNGSYIFASAHDRSLQYSSENDQHFIVSGSAAQNSPTGVGEGAEFTYGAPGFTQLDFYEDGSVWLQFWTAVGENGKVVFRKKIKDALEISEENIPDKFEEYNADMTSKKLHPLEYQVDSKKGLHDVIFGEHYRALYTHQFDFPVLHLDTFKGGVKVVKRGGGNQTRSLRLEDKNGQQYSMRALTKDVSRLLPYPFNQISAAEYIAEDNFLSTHPFGPLAIPLLADAVKVYHTNPTLYYIPKQPILGVHNDTFGGEVYLVEERPDDDWSNQPSFGRSKEIVSTSDVVEDLLKNHANRVDQPWALRARLLDLVIGDWDRHDDQWRFAKIEKDGIDYYRPIPRDRDQVFSKYDGMIAGLARWTMPFLRQLRPYDADIPNMKWHSWSSRYFDRSFLNELAWEDWKREAEWMQSQLTDEVIDAAFATWPTLAYEMTGESIKNILKKRRDDLVRFAREFYLLNAKKVDIVGTNDEDGFVVERLDNQRTRVRMYDLETKDDIKELVYDRTFYKDETEEIVLYGSSEIDKFEVTGDVNKGILVRIIGGIDKDIVTDDSEVGGLGKKTLVYDAPNDIEIKGGKDTKNMISNRRDYNIYDRKAWHYEYDFLIPVPILGYNADNGFLFGTNLTWTTYKFKKSPYHATHNVQASYAFTTQSPEILYTGDFLNTFGKWDLLLQGGLRGNKFTINYYGIGNETVLARPNDDERDYNRVRQSGMDIFPAFKRRFYADEASFYIGPLFELTKIEATPNRFLTENALGNRPEQFDRKLYAGGELGFNLASIDHPTIARRGLRLSGYLNYRNNLKASDIQQTTIGATAAIYLPLVKNKKIVFASRIGVDHAFDSAEFFYLPNLGSHNRSLRGFRFNRFYGTSAFYHNNDLRIELFKSVNNVMPFTFGITGGYDYGRVWLEDVDSDVWHTSYGGGIWLAPVDFIIISGEYFRSSEDERLMVQLGYAF